MTHCPSNQFTLPKKMFLLAFSFANFETTRESRGKANVSIIKVNYTAQKKLLLNFQNLLMKKRGETLFEECKCHNLKCIVGQSSCDVCPAGKFSDTAAAASCKSCAPGSYNDNTGSQSCKACQPGMY